MSFLGGREGCDDLRSSPLVVQPRAACDFEVKCKLRGIRSMASEMHKSSRKQPKMKFNTNFEKKRQLKKPKHQKFQKKSTSLSLNSQISEVFLSAWDLKWEICLWSWSTYTPLQNHHLSVAASHVIIKNVTGSTSLFGRSNHHLSRSV